MGVPSRDSWVLAGMTATGKSSLRPVHVQKLFFLLDERVAVGLGDRFFSFQPYDYGPFDKAVYESLESLGDAGLVEITSTSSGLRSYELTATGRARGTAELSKLPAPTQDKIRSLAEWVAGQDFASLVSAVYKAYPAMRANSVFVD